MRLIKDKESVISLIITIVFIAAYIAFAVCFVNNNSIVVYISGIIILFCMAYAFIRPLLLKRKINVLEIIEIAINIFPTTILIIIYLSALQEPIRTVATAVAASFLGGFFTLFGVGLTIKYSRIDKKEDDIQKATPHVFPISPATLHSLNNHDTRFISSNKWKTDLKKAKDDEKAYMIKDFYLSNSDMSMCVYHGFKINEQKFYFDFGQVLQRGSNSQINHNIRFKLKGKIDSFGLILTDMLDNEYFVKADIDFKDDGLNRIIEVVGVYKPELTNK